ncbi:hypothetical protein D3C74_243950 [compost metagenome]|jgi:hypothetical protein
MVQSRAIRKFIKLKNILRPLPVRRTAVKRAREIDMKSLTFIEFKSELREESHHILVSVHLLTTPVMCWRKYSNHKHWVIKY